jgi:hypothetical protein
VEVPALDVAKVTKLRQKYVGGRYILGGGPDTKPPDPGHPLRLPRPCRARAASGQDAAPPNSVMKSRRCMFDA